MTISVIRLASSFRTVTPWVTHNSSPGRKRIRSIAIAPLPLFLPTRTYRTFQKQQQRQQHRLYGSTTDSTANQTQSELQDDEDTSSLSSSSLSPSSPSFQEEPLIPPWSFDRLTSKRNKAKNNNNVVRVRQHVNPLARRFQMPTILSNDWPVDVFDSIDNDKTPLFLDIGVGKGGFLLDLASQRPLDYNYLGLEIRPLAVQFAQERLHHNPAYAKKCKGHLDFVGCNANVDLERLLSLYQQSSTSTSTTETLPLQMVTIQFPDPHFKASHAKRRVVTPELIRTLAAYMKPGANLFLQSDVQNVLDDMRGRFREVAPDYFQDLIEDETVYYPENIIGIPTEREVSVLKQDLPVFRALFVRTETPVQ